ncbi:MAG TPA: DUF1304 domain-containing protein, partial [Enterococcus sp.]|nr:DUF1304 domain-containing protein [Enterococcus sp.]
MFSKANKIKKTSLSSIIIGSK